MNTDKLVLLHGSLKNIYSCMVVVFILELLKQIYLEQKTKKELKMEVFAKKVRKC